MRRKGYKLTGFAKFMIVLIIVAPIAYLIAAYTNGQDPLKDIKNMEIFKRSEVKKETRKVPTHSGEEHSLVKELELKDLTISQLKEKVIKLEELIDAQKREIATLKQQTVNQQSTVQ